MASNQPLIPAKDGEKKPETSGVEFDKDGKPKLKTNRPLAIVAINIMCMCSVGATSIFKVVNKNGVTAPEWLLWRNVFNWVFIWLFLLPYGKSPMETNGQMDWICYRVLAGQLGFILMFYSATLIPIFLLMILIQTSPLWTSIFGLIINKEKILCIEYIAMALCFAGVLAIALSKKQTDEDESNPVHMLGIITALCMSWCWSINGVCQRRLANVYFAVVTFWHFTIGWILGLGYLTVQYFITGVFLEVHSTETYWWLLLLCVIDFIGVNTMAIAYMNDNSAFIAILGYMTIVYGYFVDLFYFHAPISGYDLVGALIICTVTISVAVYKLKLTNKAKDSEVALSEIDQEQAKTK